MLAAQRTAVKLGKATQHLGILKSYNMLSEGLSNEDNLAKVFPAFVLKQEIVMSC